MMEMVAEGFEFPEGPSWHADGCIYLVNCHSSIVHRVWEDGQVEEFGRTPGKGNGSTFGPDDLLYVADYAHRAIVRFDTDGMPSVVCDSHEGGTFRGPNDLVFASAGNLFFTDPRDSSEAAPIGSVYMQNAEGRVKRVGSEMAFPNGIALDPKELFLYVAESERNRIVRTSAGDPGEWSQFAELPGGGVPDGIRFDVEGCLWVAHFGGGAVHRLDPSGNLISSYVVGGQRPTNLEFGGSDGRTLYVTDADTNTLRRMRAPSPGVWFAK